MDVSGPTGQAKINWASWSQDQVFEGSCVLTLKVLFKLQTRIYAKRPLELWTLTTADPGQTSRKLLFRVSVFSLHKSHNKDNNFEWFQARYLMYWTRNRSEIRDTDGEISFSERQDSGRRKRHMLSFKRSKSANLSGLIHGMADREKADKGR